MKRRGRITLSVMVVGFLLAFVATSLYAEYLPESNPYWPVLKGVRSSWVSGRLQNSSTMPRNVSGIPVVLEYLGSPPYKRVTYTDAQGRFFFKRSLLAPKGMYRIHTLGWAAKWCRDVIFRDDAKSPHYFTITCTPPPPSWRGH